MKDFLIHLGWRALGGFIGLLVGVGLAVGLGDAIGKALDISNFEGGRGYFVFLVLLPLFGLSGLILGALMIDWRWQWNLGIALSLGAAGALFVWVHLYSFIPAPPQVETVGNFQLLTYTSEDWGEHYALRYRDEPFAIAGRAGLFGDQTATYTTLNAVITFTLPLSNTAPTFIVNVGDPNNSSFFYLVREENGQAEVTELCATSGGVVAADWLDVAPANPTAPRNSVLRRAQLMGGRWLLLGDNCVFAVQTLTAYRFDTYPIGDDADAAIYPSKLPLGLAPDHQSFVRLGSSDVRDAAAGDFRGTVAKLIVYNFVNNTSYTVPVDRVQMRYATLERIDAAWLDHYFEWQLIDGAPAHLAPRAAVAPLPYQGYLTRSGQSPQYNLTPVKAELFAQLVSFLEQQFRAVQLESTNYDTSTYVDLQINDQKITVSYADDGYSVPAIALWQAPQSEQPGQLVEEIARRFDEVLRTGAYDALFLGDPLADTPIGN